MLCAVFPILCQAVLVDMTDATDLKRYVLGAVDLDVVAGDVFAFIHTVYPGFDV